MTQRKNRWKFVTDMSGRENCQDERIAAFARRAVEEAWAKVCFPSSSSAVLCG